MREKRILAKSLVLTACVLGVMSATHAQTVTLSGAIATGFSGLTTFAGPPSLTTALTGTPGGTFGSGSLSLGGDTTLNFPGPIQFITGAGAGTTSGSNSIVLQFVIAGIPETVHVPIAYSYTGPIGGSSVLNMTPTATNFTTGSGTFRVEFGNFGGGGLGNGTVLPLSGTFRFLSGASAPEPATVALFGLGLAPVAVAIRRRRK